MLFFENEKKFKGRSIQNKRCVCERRECHDYGKEEVC